MRYYFDMYNLLSEPSLSLWTRRLRTIDADYPAETPTGAEQFTVTVTRAGQTVEDELVAVRKSDEGIFAAGYTDSSGTVVLPLDPAPLVPGPMAVTVTGHDDRPHEGTTEVIPIDGAWVKYVSHTVDDSEAGCETDGIADIGEEARFVITVENIRSEAAVAPIATLASTADVAVLDNPLDLGTIPAGESTEAVFRVRIGAGVACEQVADFTLTLDCSDCDEQEDGFVEGLEIDLRDDVGAEGFEHGGAEPDGWSHEALVGTDDWQMVDSDSHNGTWSYFSSGTAVQKDVALITAQLLPEGESTGSFWQQ